MLIVGLKIGSLAVGGYDLRKEKRTTSTPRTSRKVTTEKVKNAGNRAASRASTNHKKKNTQGNTFALGKEIQGLLIMAIAVVAMAGIVGVNVGFAGDFISRIFTYGFGVGGIVPAIASFYYGWILLYKGERLKMTKKGITYILFFTLLLALPTLWSVPEGNEFDTTNLPPYGGLLGALVTSVFRLGLSTPIAIFFVLVLVLICIIIITRLSLGKGLRKAGGKAAVGVAKAKEKAEEKLVTAKEHIHEWQMQRKEREEAKKSTFYDQEKDLRYKGELSESTGDRWKSIVSEFDDAAMHERSATDYVDTPIDELPLSLDAEMESKPEKNTEILKHIDDDPTEKVHTMEAPLIGNSNIGKENKQKAAQMAASAATGGSLHIPLVDNIPSFEGTEADTAAVSVSTEEVPKKRRIETPYHYPPLTILSKGKIVSGITEEVAQKASLLESTLDSFGIKARIINATQGPAVTRYELEPAPGVKVSKIVNLTDDIALNLAAAGIRMEAPIPGKAAIGIEIPNTMVSPVNLRDVLDCDDFLKAKGGIPVGLGKDIAGKPIITDLSKMPHLLVAGSTGSGKSVCINTLIASILFSRKPSDVKLILIDPKMVELSNYNGIPHLMAPVVTDMKKAASVLRWAVKEMESRYRVFAETNVRDVKRYNELHADKAMPLVVIIIDELADLMMVSPADVEDSICRLAQMARAAGLHLVLATQRPSVDVITGTIKANVPSRISFAVSSQIDSRTILDMAGAEKLLGKGDMLFNPIGASKPIRIQGAFISDGEVEELVQFIKGQGVPQYNEKILSAESSNEEKEGKEDFFTDELLERAIDLVMDSGNASVSMLQRRFRVGYTRAARLVDTMEQMQIVGPNVGSKAREILMSREDVQQRFFATKEETGE